MNARHLVSIGACAAALFTVGCGYGIKTSTDYDRHASFSSYRTFYIANGNSSGNPVTDQMVRVDVASALTLKEWREVADSEAQAAVVIHAATKDKHSFQTIYHGWASGTGTGAGSRHDAVRRGLQNRHAGGRRVRRETRQAICTASRPAQVGDPTSVADATEQVVDRMSNDFPPTSQGIVANVLIVLTCRWTWLTARQHRGTHHDDSWERRPVCSASGN